MSSTRQLPAARSEHRIALSLCLTLSLSACAPATGADASVDAPADTPATDVSVTDASVDAPEDVSSPDESSPEDSAAPSQGTVLLDDVAPYDIAVGGGYVYFTTANTVRRIPMMTGGAPETMFTAMGNAAQSIDADATGIIWTERDPNSTVRGAVRACPHSGCPATPAATAGGESTGRLSLSASRVAWVSASSNSVFSAARGAMQGGLVYMSPSGMRERYTPMDVAIDGDEVFWATGGLPVPNATGTVLKCTLGTAACAPIMLAATTIGQPLRVAAAGTSVVFVSNTGVYRVGRDGAGLTRLSESGSNNYADVVTDGTTAYWAINGTLSRCSLAACAPAVIAEVPQQFSAGLVLHSTGLYWGLAGRGGSSAGSIRRIGL